MLTFNVSPIEQSPGKIVTETHLIIKLGLTRVFQSHGYKITPEHWSLLSELCKKDGITQAELAKRARKDRPNTTRILDTLERNAFIRRVRDPNDRRSYRIFLTRRGKTTQERLVPLVTDFFHRAFAELTQDELDTFLRTNKKIIKNLSQVSSL